jgi:hypothetical protein
MRIGRPLDRRLAPDSVSQYLSLTTGPFGVDFSQIVPIAAGRATHRDVFSICRPFRKFGLFLLESIGGRVSEID